MCLFPHSRSRALDANRKPTGVTYPSGKTLTYVQGNCCNSVDSTGNQTHWEYDLLGRKTAKFAGWNNGAGTQVATYAYDAVGRLSQVGDARGDQKTYIHDGEGRLNVIQYSVIGTGTQATPNVFLTYEPAYGRLASVTDGTGITTYAYHPILPSDGAFGDGAVATESKVTADTLGNYTHTYTYDALGRLATGPRQASAQWDALGRLTNATSALGAFTFGYDGISGRVVNSDSLLTGAAVAARTGFTYGNAADGRRLTGIIHQKADAAGVAAGTPDWSTLSQHSYGYDAQGRLASWQKWATDAQASWNLIHDGDDQLTGVVEKDAQNTALGGYSYAYDSAGNRTSAAYGVVATDEYWLREWSVNAMNQLTAQTAGVGGGVQFTYDADGNTLGDGARTYAWDAENRLVSIGYANDTRTVEWDYDAFSRRVRQRDTDGSATVTRDLIWEGLSLIESRNQTTGEVRKYYGNGETRTITLNPQPSTLNLLYLTDHLGSIRQLVDGDGNVRASYDYSPEGQRTKLNGDLDADFGFTGHYTHDGTGLVIAPYRFYDPATQRWLSRDPIGETGGINLYGYVQNDPINAFDPLGNDIEYANHKVAVGKYHSKLIITPTNQDKYKDDPRFQNKDGAGKQFCTIGAGPDEKGWDKGPGGLAGKMLAGINRERDMSQPSVERNKLVIPNFIKDEDEAIELLFQAVTNYNSDPSRLPEYTLFPSKDKCEVNSNGFVSGILLGTGFKFGPGSQIKNNIPGFTNPVPPGLFRPVPK